VDLKDLMGLNLSNQAMYLSLIKQPNQLRKSLKNKARKKQKNQKKNLSMKKISLLRSISNRYFLSIKLKN